MNASVWGENQVDLIWIWYDDDNFHRQPPVVWDWFGETMINGLQDSGSLIVWEDGVK